MANASVTNRTRYYYHSTFQNNSTGLYWFILFQRLSQSTKFHIIDGGLSSSSVTAASSSYTLNRLHYYRFIYSVIFSQSALPWVHHSPFFGDPKVVWHGWHCCECFLISVSIIVLSFMLQIAFCRSTHPDIHISVLLVLKHMQSTNFTSSFWAPLTLSGLLL